MCILIQIIFKNFCLNACMMLHLHFVVRNVGWSHQPVGTSTPISKVQQEPFILDTSPVPQKEVLVNQKRKPDECDAVVTINWAKRQKKKVLPPQLSSLGKMLCRGTKKQIAKAAWKCETIRPHLYEEIVKEIHKECVYMCVKDTKKAKNWKKNMESSCLRKTDKESLENFSFDALLKELQVRAPLFLLVLKTAAFNSKDVNEKWKASITVAAATCLRNRSRSMIAFQLLVAILNRHSGFMVKEIISELIIKCLFLLLVHLQ